MRRTSAAKRRSGRAEAAQKGEPVRSASIQRRMRGCRRVRTQAPRPTTRSTSSSSCSASDNEAVRVSAKADYALRATIELAAATDGGPVKGERIAQAQEIPLKFLENI